MRRSGRGAGAERLLQALLALAPLAATLAVSPADAQWTRRGERWPPRGAWTGALAREHPEVYREFNGIDFGHAHLAETLLRTQDSAAVERARREVLDFIWSSPEVAPDEGQVAPTMARTAWEVQRAFDWAHAFHRSLYDLLSSERVRDIDGAYRRILADYLSSSDAITSHGLDHAGALWGFPESRSFRDRFGAFNSQIWVYHWLQAAAYEVQLRGQPDARGGGTGEQRRLMPRVLERYRRWLREPPLEWRFMPLFFEVAPGFTRRFPEAAAIFDNLHMAHDNMDDILSRPDLFPTLRAKREAMLRVLAIYLHANHEPAERFAQFEVPGGGGHAGHGAPEGADPHSGSAGPDPGERPPSAGAVLGEESSPAGEGAPEREREGHGGHPR